ncbi:hypothetical protein PHAVU_003G259800 [Phaseolus vulgaris]|uniref:Uncharacterized protein n=1 Tax=Phaseolus vulgaris TaxID=3885 RepID=V7CFH5_PHAVU|nr:hypothetical protein PHAVU_003G259800g [Phaseolus vulgaris]ESW28108.1 hypothetical protein PHAVU_003G259800g [Phaseolus vulgaris]
MEKAKKTIMKSFNNNESKYKDVFRITDNRWTCQLHRPLHSTGHFLNPKFCYSSLEKEYDLEATNELCVCIRDSLKRNRMDHKMLHDLVYIKYNQQLAQRYNIRDEINLIVLNDINEWLVGPVDNEERANELLFCYDDPTLNWITIYEALGVEEPIIYTCNQ